MSQDQTKKEALFNEVKGSLFEFLVARELARVSFQEEEFLQSLDKNYLNVLTQQDRMVRQFYPEMTDFLNVVSIASAKKLIEHLGFAPKKPKLLGKLVNSGTNSEWHEADLLLDGKSGTLPVSLKLNKKSAFVNTKSGGIKSFFSQYFSFLPLSVQSKFNQLVDMEFNRMAIDLHAFHQMEYEGNFHAWVRRGFSELPGELGPEEREILKRYYARIASELHNHLSSGVKSHPKEFAESLYPLLGFSSPEIMQLICFHDFKNKSFVPEIDIHSFSEVESSLKNLTLEPFGNISSVEFTLGDWNLQVRIKPMNKFTTTAIKMNCSVKVKRPNEL